MRPIFLFLFLGLLIKSEAFAQPSTTPATFPVKSYLPDAYHADYQCFNIYQTESGLILVGNVNGLLIYDGSTWKLFTMPNNNIVRSLNSHGNKIFVGGWGDFGYFEPDPELGLRYTSLQKQTKLQDFEIGDVWNVYSDADTIYYLTYHYVFKLLPNKELQCLCPKNQQGIFSVYHNGLIYIPDKEKGLVAVGRNYPYGLLPGGDFYRNKEITCILPLKDYLLLITAQGNVFQYNQGVSNELEWKASQYFRLKGINSGKVINDSLFAFTTRNSGIVFTSNKGNIVSFLDKRNGLVSNSLKLCLVDKQNGLWVSSIEGVSRIETGSGFKIIEKGLGFDGALTDILYTKDKWYISSSTGLFSVDQKSYLPFYNKQPQFRKIEPVDWIVFNIIDTPSGIFCASKNGILRIYGDKAELLYSFGAEILTYLPKFNVILCGGWNGIGVINCNNKIRSINRLNGIEEYILEMKLIADNKIVCTTSSGYLLNIEFHKLDGENLIIKSTTKIWNEIESPAWNVNGLSILNGDIIVSSSNGLSLVKAGSDSISKIQLPLSIATIKSLHEVSDEEFIIEDIKNNLHLVEFDEQHNLVSNDSIFSRVKCRKINSVKVIDSNWFFVDPDKVNVINTSSKKVVYNNYCLIRSIMSKQLGFLYSGYDRLPESLTLNYGNNSIEFEFSCPYYDNESENSYSYKLDGFDNEWSNYNLKNNVSFTNLPEGNYCFRVKSKNVLNIESNESTISIIILPPWYRTGIAYIIYLISLIIVIVLASVLYNIRLRKEKLKLENIVRLRTYEIVEQKNQILEKNEELKQQNEEILSQRDEIDDQRRIIEQKNQILTESISYAYTIQQAILPTQQELESIFKDSFILNSPKDVVGGDFYWVSKINSTIYCAISDCTGHGVPGGFLSMLGVTLLTEIHSNYPDSNPAERLQLLKNKIIKSLHQQNLNNSKDGMEMSLFSINQETLLMQYAISFGKMIIVRGNKVFRLAGDRISIGLSYSRVDVFNNYIFQLEKNDMIYCLTDGYVDQLSKYNNKKIGTRKLIEILEQIAEKSLLEQKQLLWEYFEQWKGKMDQVDDVLFIGIRV